MSRAGAVDLLEGVSISMGGGGTPRGVRVANIVDTTSITDPGSGQYFSQAVNNIYSETRQTKPLPPPPLPSVYCRDRLIKYHRVTFYYSESAGFHS